MQDLEFFAYIEAKCSFPTERKAEVNSASRIHASLIIKDPPSKNTQIGAREWKTDRNLFAMLFHQNTESLTFILYNVPWPMLVVFVDTRRHLIL